MVDEFISRISPSQNTARDVITLTDENGESFSFLLDVGSKK